MAECKDCIHYDVCKYRPLAIGVDICDVFRNTADVVPKSEVEKLKSDLEGYKHLDTIVTTALNILTDDIRQKVAREIFEEIEKQIDRGLSVITKILNAKGGRANGKTVLLTKYDVYIEAKKYITELKKKYTENENG